MVLSALLVLVRRLFKVSVVHLMACRLVVPRPVVFAMRVQPHLLVVPGLGLGYVSVTTEDQVPVALRRK